MTNEGYIYQDTNIIPIKKHTFVLEAQYALMCNHPSHPYYDLTLLLFQAPSSLNHLLPPTETTWGAKITDLWKEPKEQTTKVLVSTEFPLRVLSLEMKSLMIHQMKIKIWTNETWMVVHKHGGKTMMRSNFRGMIPQVYILSMAYKILRWHIRS